MTRRYPHNLFVFPSCPCEVTSRHTNHSPRMHSVGRKRLVKDKSYFVVAHLVAVRPRPLYVYILSTKHRVYAVYYHINTAREPVAPHVIQACGQCGSLPVQFHTVGPSRMQSWIFSWEKIRSLGFKIIGILFETGKPGKSGRMARISLISGGGSRFAYFHTAQECAWKQPAASLECKGKPWAGLGMLA